MTAFLHWQQHLSFSHAALVLLVLAAGGLGGGFSALAWSDRNTKRRSRR